MFISARAEKTYLHFVDITNEAVHLRACGEHPLHGVAPSGISGSSPRVRRTLMKIVLPFPDDRFISARAENTAHFRDPKSCEPVHLRACGEHETNTFRFTGKSGSSPRVRRTLTPAWGSTPSRRFISARAENTHIQDAGTTPAPVHLRACGEHNPDKLTFGLVFGSSPRVRRTLLPVNA